MTLRRKVMILFASGLFGVLPAAAAIITGVVRGPDGKPVAVATVRTGPDTKTLTGEDGCYTLKINSAAVVNLTAEFAGFVLVERLVAATSDQRVDLNFTQLAGSVQSITVQEDVRANDILNPDPAQRFTLHDEMLDANPGRSGAPVSIPGLPVESASGGIKAPQYFAPGVAGDHGEPVAQFFTVGSYLVPNNLSANAHGNGYADPNVIIPAVIESVETDAGAFNVREGNHAVNLGVTLGLRSRLEPFLTIAGDAHDADVAAGWSPGGPATRAWIALETAFGDGLLRTPEHRRQDKINAFRVFDLSRHTLTLFGTGYYGVSAIPGLVPVGVAGLNDTIDRRQRDQTHTVEIAANDIWRLDPSSTIHLSGYFRTYNMSLLSNFGDGLIRQSEFRTAMGGQPAYVKTIGESISILAGVDYSREAPRRLDLDRYASTDPAPPGPFQQITANNVTLTLLSPYLSVNGRLTSWLRFNLGWRRDEIGFENIDLLAPTRSFNQWIGVNSPKATLNLLAPDSLPLPSLSLSFGQAFFTNDPRTGVGSAAASLVSRAHVYQIVAMKRITGMDLRVTAGQATQEQSLARIDPDTGLQSNLGPSRNRYITFSARRRFGFGTWEASFSKADARDLAGGAPLAEAPRLILDVLGTIDRLPFHLRARGEFEQVGRKPLGDGFTAGAVHEFRGALMRPFFKGLLDAGVNFQIARGYTGQTTEVLALAGDRDSFERVAGVRVTSYAAASATLHF